MQGRFKSVLVEKESYLLELARYVVLNPIRAKMVGSVRHWPWSSYQATAGQVEAPEFLTIDWILSQFGVKRVPAMRAYRHFVSQGRGADVWEDLRAGSLLGSDRFIEQMKPRLTEAPLDPNVLRRERDAARPSLEAVFSDVTDRQTRNQRICDAVRDHHYTLQEVGDHIRLHFSTISIIAKRVSEERANSKVKA
jgi:hypothetical protein